MTFISTPPLQRRIGAFAIGLITSLVVAWAGFAIFFEIGWIKRFAEVVDGFVYDTLFFSRQTPPDELVIIDLHTLATSDVRVKCAELIEGLQRAGARAIGIDLRFIRNSGNPGDARLVQATLLCPQLIHAFNLTFGEAQSGSEEALLTTRHALQSSIQPEDSDCFLPASAVELPFSALFEASHDMANISFVPDEDGGDRHFPLVIRYGNSLYPGLPLQMVRRFLGVTDDRIELHFCRHECNEAHADDFILLKISETDSLKIPVDSRGQILVNFIRPDRVTPYFVDQALGLLRANEDTTFKNKMVLVVNGSITDDYSFHNPLHEQILSNWVIHASVISQILNQAFMTEYDGISTSALVFTAAFVLLAWLVLVEIRFAWIKQRTWLVLLTACVLLLVVVAIKLYWGHWTGWVLPCLSLYVSYMSAKFYLTRWRPPVPVPPQYEDFDLHVQQKNETTYLVDVTSSPAGEEAEGEFSLDLEALAKILYELRTFGAGSEALKTFGATLFETLFQPPIHSRYDESLGIISGSGLKRLRLKLGIEPAALSTLPWEFLYDPKRKEYLALSDKLSIVRFLMIPKAITPLAVKPPLKVLVAISSPADYPPLEVEKEKERITTALQPLTKKHRMQVDVLERTTIAALRPKLNAGYHVLHFIGHGSFRGSNHESEGCLIFENETGMGELVNAGRLKLLLNNTAVRLVILNACETAEASNLDYFLGVAPMLVTAGIPAVIAMQFKIPDQSAVLFAEKLYESLAQSYQVDAAVEAARKALALEYGLERLDWGMPVLFMRAPDGILFKASVA